MFIPNGTDKIYSHPIDMLSCCYWKYIRDQTKINTEM